MSERVGAAAHAAGDEASDEAVPRRAPESQDEGLRFDDPYWDDAFCAWWDPSLRTCC